MDKGAKEAVRKSLKIVYSVPYKDGSYIGGGFIEDPAFKDNDLGIIVVDKYGTQTLAFEMNMQNLLILSQVITTTVRMYIEKKLGGFIGPMLPKFSKQRGLHQ